MSLSGIAVDSQNISNLRDFLSVYNKITHECFKHCISNLNYYNVTEEENQCINRCSGKFLNGNNRAMSTFMEVQSKRQKALIEEAEQKERERLAGQTSSSTDSAAGLPGPATAASILFQTPRPGADDAQSVTGAATAGVTAPASAQSASPSNS